MCIKEFIYLQKKKKMVSEYIKYCAAPKLVHFLWRNSLNSTCNIACVPAAQHNLIRRGIYINTQAHKHHMLLSIVELVCWKKNTGRLLLRCRVLVSGVIFFANIYLMRVLYNDALIIFNIYLIDSLVSEQNVSEFIFFAFFKTCAIWWM